MFNFIFSHWLRVLGGSPTFQIFGKARAEPSWRIIDVFATQRRSHSGRLPLWRGTCTTWSDRVIAVGWDFARQLLAEQACTPATRENPVVVFGGRVRDCAQRQSSAGPEIASASEVLAHECGHTGQARRMGIAYLPLVGAVTLFGEGPNWWNHFENQASEVGLFGGLVPGSLCHKFASKRLRNDSSLGYSRRLR